MKYRVAQKKTEWDTFHQYVDAITGVYEVTSPEKKLYQDHQFWFSSLFSRAHFVRQCRGPKFSLRLFSLTLIPLGGGGHLAPPVVFFAVHLDRLAFHVQTS